MKNIALFFGGKSVEHDISIITAMQTISGLGNEYNLLPVYITSQGKMVTAKNLTNEKIYLDFNNLVDKPCEVLIPSALGEIWIVKKRKIKEKIKIDCALLCTHGHGGEDGSLQGMLELAEIAYTSCDSLSSGLCMDKVATKVFLTNADIPTPKYVFFSIDEFKANRQNICEKVKEKLSFPCIVKPANLGSSVGISICEDENSLINAIENAGLFDKKIIVEKFIKNAREFCCAVITNSGRQITSKVNEVKKSEFFTFEDKYLTKQSDEQNEITQALESEIKTLAVKSYQCLNCYGVVRVDFLYDGKKHYVNELNTIPGSLSFSMFKTQHCDLLKVLIQEGINRKENKNDIVYQFNSKAIENYIEMKKNIKK